MAIEYIQQFQAGNALSLKILVPYCNAWKILRKEGGAPLSHDDAAAHVIPQRNNLSVVDADGLINGVAYHYLMFIRLKGVWSAAGKVIIATPDSTYRQLGTDVLSLVRERMDLGLNALVDRGLLTHSADQIQVLTAPPVSTEIDWPIVTTHLQSDSSAERGLGEYIAPDECDSETNEWSSFEGWISDVRISIIAWSQNPDQRIKLRIAIKNLLIANLSVFEAHEMINIDLSQSDTEDFEGYSVPVYQVVTTLSCQAPSFVETFSPTISRVDIDPHCGLAEKIL